MKILLSLFLCFLLTDGFGQQEKKRSQGEGILPDSIVFAYSVAPFYKYRTDGKPGRVINIYFPGKSEALTYGTLACEGKTERFTAQDVKSGMIEVLLPDGAGVRTETSAKLFLRTDKKEHNTSITVQPLRQWTVFIYPHSHVDIGYTNLQEEVEKIHVRNVDVGIDLAKKTQHHPEGARFVWNPEATWVVKAYLKTATASQRQSFIEAVRKGWIQLDAGHSNMNTTTCSDEELLQFFKNSNEIEKITNVPITTMVQMDVPGAAWGLVQAAVQNGVNGFISFPNYFDLRKVWEHKPFYWKGPDGKSKMLFLQGFPYGIGYTIKGSKYGLAKLQTFSKNYDRVSTANPMENFVDRFIFREMDRLERELSPYDYFTMTWSMADNCVIDADLPEAVKQWNETYAYPKLVIAGAKEILAAYEKKYGAIIPEYSGDFTEFWTNGLGSDAAHVGMGRRAKENLVQAETLYTLLQQSSYPRQKIDSAWEDILLSAEHTWGYQTPAASLAKVIEKRKAAFFSDAEEKSKRLLQEVGSSTATGETFAVVNTLSWDRAGIVTLTKEQSKKGNRVIDAATGKAVLSQRLTTGELIFQTASIPALSSRLYKVVGGVSPKNSNDLTVGPTGLRNKFLFVRIDSASGNIRSIVDLQSNYNFVANEGLNSYHYLPGVFNGKDSVSAPLGIESSIVAIKEAGPLLVSLSVRSKAVGTEWMEREVKLYANQRFVQIKNTFAKTGTRKKEGHHFGFAFHLPEATAKVDAPWSVLTPETDQLRGANRNWMTFQRWVDVSNKSKGVTWTAIESPLIEWGEMSGTILDGARQDWLWKKSLEPSSTLYSWPLNNHWDTNFPLEQSGVMVQQYAMLFHGAYDAVIANRFGTEQHRPLVAVRAKQNLLERSFVRISNPRVAVSVLKESADKKGLVLRLRSYSAQLETVMLTWPKGAPQKVQRCTAEETPGEEVKNGVVIQPQGTESLYLTF